MYNIIYFYKNAKNVIKNTYIKLKYWMSFASLNYRLYPNIFNPPNSLTLTHSCWISGYFILFLKKSRQVQIVNFRNLFIFCLEPIIPKMVFRNRLMDIFDFWSVVPIPIHGSVIVKRFNSKKNISSVYTFMEHFIPLWDVLFLCWF